MVLKWLPDIVMTFLLLYGCVHLASDIIVQVLLIVDELLEGLRVMDFSAEQMADPDTAGHKAFSEQGMDRLVDDNLLEASATSDLGSLAPIKSEPIESDLQVPWDPGVHWLEGKPIFKEEGMSGATGQVDPIPPQSWRMWLQKGIGGVQSRHQ